MLKIFLNSIGGLGIFLFGMKLMSENIQKLAGVSLRKKIDNIVNTFWKNVLVGGTLTSILQSSSVVLCIVIGLVNSRLLSLTQSLGLILGANIGTTVTAWIFTFKIGDLSLFFTGMMIIIYLYLREEKIRSRIISLMGLGMIFLGLQIMSESLTPLRYNQEYLNFFQKIKADDFFNTILTVGIGAILTAIIQSSSAAIGILITLLNQNLLDLKTAMGLVIGANLGTTITPLLATLTSGKNGKITGYICFFVNLFQGIWGILFFPIYSTLVLKLENKIEPAVLLALFHTTLNIINTFFIFFFSKRIETFLQIYEDDSQVERKTEIDFFLKMTTDSLTDEIMREIHKTSLSIKEMFYKIEKIFENEEDKKDFEIITKLRDDILDIAKEIKEGTFKFLRDKPRDKNYEEVRRSLIITNEYKEIAGYLFCIYKKIFEQKNDKKEIYLQENILKFHLEISEIFRKVDEILEFQDVLLNGNIKKELKVLKNSCKELKKDYISSLDLGEIKDIQNANELEIINYYRRLIDHLEKIY
nr:Na/Pi symporter [uncultured Cetobacterium sp.]